MVPIYWSVGTYGVSPECAAHTLMKWRGKRESRDAFCVETRFTVFIWTVIWYLFDHWIPHEIFLKVRVLSSQVVFLLCWPLRSPVRTLDLFESIGTECSLWQTWIRPKVRDVKEYRSGNHEILINTCEGSSSGRTDYIISFVSSFVFTGFHL